MYGRIQCDGDLPDSRRSPSTVPMVAALPLMRSARRVYGHRQQPGILEEERTCFEPRPASFVQPSVPILVHVTAGYDHDDRREVLLLRCEPGHILWRPWDPVEGNHGEEKVHLGEEQVDENGELAVGDDTLGYEGERR